MSGHVPNFRDEIKTATTAAKHKRIVLKKSTHEYKLLNGNSPYLPSVIHGTVEMPIELLIFLGLCRKWTAEVNSATLKTLLQLWNPVKNAETSTSATKIQ